MKVLLVHNSYQQPGGEDVVFDLERQILEGTGHEVLTYCRSNWEIQAHSAVRRLAFSKDLVWSTSSRHEIAALLERAKPDLVHVHNTFVMISPSIYSACKAAHIPVVQTLHNYRLLCPASGLYRDGKVCEECIDHTLWRAVQHGCYHDSRTATAGVALMLAWHRRLGTWNDSVNFYIAPTQFARQKLIRGGLPEKKIVVKPNFVHPDPGVQDEKGEYVLFAGRLSPEKGVRTVLAAWKHLRQHIPLKFIGSGPQRAELELSVVEQGLSDVSLQGSLSHDGTLSAIKRARFLLSASELYETFGIVAVEAFACGVPVIAPRLGTMAEIVEDGHTGLHFTPGDPEDLAAKVEWAWAHPKEMEAMGRAARSEYEAKYTAERNYQILMEIYQRAVHENLTVR